MKLSTIKPAKVQQIITVEVVIKVLVAVVQQHVVTKVLSRSGYSSKRGFEGGQCRYNVVSLNSVSKH